MEDYIEINALLFESDKYKSLTNDARILYSFLENENRMSKINGIHDKDGTFVIYPRKDLSEGTCLSEKKIAKGMKQLRELGLIKEKKQGRGRPNKIYVMPLQEK